jgi:hypothetical protein
MTKQAKEEIDFICSLRKHDMLTYHNYTPLDTTYKECKKLYYRNRKETYIANNSDNFVIGITFIIFFIFLFLRRG